MSVPQGVHVIRLECGNANAIDSALLDTLSSGLRAAIDDGKHAVVLTGYDNYFSAGLNLKALPESRDGMEEFLTKFEQVNLELLNYPLPLVAAVNGHAIAGGCVIACTADVRIGADAKYKLGVSEVSLGIVFPSSAFEIMRHTLTPSAVPTVLLGGQLLTPTEAKDAGILHELVAPDALLDRATALAAELGGKPQQAFRHSKLALRAPMLERIALTHAESRQGFLESWFSPEVVARRKAMLE